MDNQPPKEPGMASPATYQITAKGKLTEHWAEWFNGAIMQIERSLEGSPHTILTCRVKDQAHLLGILNRLNSLNLPLLQVAFINPEQKRNAP
jgi:hypothetical protein